MKKSDFKGIYAEMSEILGEEIVKIIHKHYKGQQVNFPMKLYSNVCRKLYNRKLLWKNCKRDI